LGFGVWDLEFCAREFYRDAHQRHCSDLREDAARYSIVPVEPEDIVSEQHRLQDHEQHRCALTESERTREAVKLPAEQQAASGVVEIQPEELAGGRRNPSDQAVGKKVAGFGPTTVFANRVQPGPLVDTAVMLPSIRWELQVDAGDVEEQGEEKPGGEALERIAKG